MLRYTNTMVKDRRVSEYSTKLKFKFNRHYSINANNSCYNWCKVKRQYYRK